jgi:hypothetical protein
VTKLTISPQGPPDLVDEDETDLQEQAAVIVEDDEDGAKKAELPARATLNANGTVTLKLVRPITLTISKGGKERQEVCAELTFRELTGADLRVVAQERDEMKRTILTLARATGMSSPRMNVLFDRMAQRDVGGATAVISYFQE